MKTSSVPDDLPLEARTLLGTVREVHIKPVEPGMYYHFGLEYCVENLVNKLNLESHEIKELGVIELSINVDGLPLAKRSTSQVYPTLCKLLVLIW